MVGLDRKQTSAQSELARQVAELPMWTLGVMRSAYRWYALQRINADLNHIPAGDHPKVAGTTVNLSHHRLGSRLLVSVSRELSPCSYDATVWFGSDEVTGRVESVSATVTDYDCEELAGPDTEIKFDVWQNPSTLRITGMQKAFDIVRTARQTVDQLRT